MSEQGSDAVKGDQAALKDLEGRVLAIEKRLGMARAKPISVTAPELSREVRSAVTPTRPRSETSTVSSEPRGGNFLGAVGVLFFVLAAGFFIRLAVDAGWLTPLRQLGGATLFGALLISLGFNLRGRDAAYAGFLPGAGIVVLFMSAFGGHLYYGLYDSMTAVVLVSAASMLALTLFTSFRHDFFLVSSIVGTYLVPMLLVPKGGDLIGGSFYFVFWDILYCGCSVLLGRRLLIGVTAYLAFAVYGMYANASAHPIDTQTQLLFQAVQFVILSGSVALFSIVRRISLTSGEAWTFFPVLLFFYTIEYSLLEKIDSGSAPWYALVFALVLMGIYSGAKRMLARESLESAPMVATFSTLVVVHSVYVELLPRTYGTWFALAALLVLSGLRESAFTYARFWPVHIMVWGITGLEYLECLFNFSNSDPSTVLFKNLAFCALLVAAYVRRTDRRTNGGIMVLSNIQALAACSRLSSIVATGVTAQYLTSGLWGALALGILIVGNQTRDAILARSSLGIFVLVAMKVLFSDIDQSSSFMRVVALVVIGGLLYVGGIFLRRVNQWSRE